jgi:hypothetical protein
MKNLILFFVFCASAFATDVTTTMAQVTAIPFGTSGQGGCNNQGCMWATTQTGGGYTGQSELSWCPISAGQCTLTPVCITCGNDITLFNQSTGYGATATFTESGGTTLTFTVATGGFGYSSSTPPTITAMGSGTCTAVGSGSGNATPTIVSGHITAITATGCTGWTSSGNSVYIGGAADKGQVAWGPTNSFVAIGVSVPSMSPNASAGGDSVGNGTQINIWVFPTSVSSGVLTLGTGVNVTNITQTYQGTLFARFGGCGPGTGSTTCIWFMSRVANGDSSHSGGLGDFRIRLIPYTTPGGVFTLGTEQSYPKAGGYQLCFNTVQTCSTYGGKNYGEMSGYYDYNANMMLIQVAPDTACSAASCTGLGNYTWQNEIAAFAPTGTYGQFDVLVPSASSGVCGWNEHANVVNGLMYWTTSNFATVSYNGCATSFTTPPLDKAAVPISYTIDSSSNVHMVADMNHAFPITGINVIGNADRTAVCAARLAQVSVGCSNSTVISGGFSSFTTTGLIPLLIKDNLGNASTYLLSPNVVYSSRLF